jgi:cell division protein FtsA
MLSRHTNITTVNVGSANSTAVIAEVDSEGRAGLLGYGQCASAGLSDDQITDIRELSGVIAECVGQAEEMAKLSSGALVLAIGGEHVRILNSRGGLALNPGDDERRSRNITRQDIKKVLDKAGKVVLAMDLELLHVLPGNFLVDGRRVKNPEGIGGNRLDVEVLIVAARQTIMRSLTKAAELGGYRVRKFCYRPLATSRAVLSDEELDQGACLIDIGGRHTDVALFKENRLLFSSTLLLGGANITSDAGQLLAINQQEAEKIKLKYGYCGTLAGEDVKFQLSGVGGDGALWRLVRKSALGQGVIQPRVEEILDESVAAMKEYLGGEQWMSCAALTGGTSQLPGIRDLAKVRLPFTVSSGKKNIVFDNLDEESARPEYATALGLVAYDIEQRLSRREEVRDNPLTRWCDKVIRRIHTVL